MVCDVKSHAQLWKATQALSNERYVSVTDIFVWLTWYAALACKTGPGHGPGPVVTVNSYRY